MGLDSQQDNQWITRADVLHVCPAPKQLHQSTKWNSQHIKQTLHTFWENQSSGRPGFPKGLIALLTETLTSTNNRTAAEGTHNATRLQVIKTAGSFNIQHTHTHLTALFSGTTQVSRYQKGKPIWILVKQDSEWQWYQLGCMQVCISLQTDNHSSISPLSFLQAGCPSCRPTNSI